MSAQALRNSMHVDRHSARRVHSRQSVYIIDRDNVGIEGTVIMRIGTDCSFDGAMCAATTVLQAQ